MTYTDILNICISSIYTHPEYVYTYQEYIYRFPEYTHIQKIYTYSEYAYIPGIYMYPEYIYTYPEYIYMCPDIYTHIQSVYVYIVYIYIYTHISRVCIHTHTYPEYKCYVTLVVSDSLSPMDCSLPASSVHGILQARLLEWVAMPSSRGSSQPRD